MVNATVDNEPVSVQLAEDESVSVPNGEVWDVTVNCTAASGSTNELVIDVVLNDRSVGGSSYSAQTVSGETAAATSTVPFNTVFVGGDVIELAVEGNARGEEPAAIISGYVVKS